MTAKRRWLIVLLGVPFLLLLLIAAASWFGARYALETYTALQPRPLPVTKLDALADADLRRKLDVFSESYEAGQPASLELTAPELNALIAENTQLDRQVFITIQDGQLRGQVSLPLELTGLERLKGRWLNSDASFSLTASNGVTSLNVTALTLNGRSLPTVMQTALTQRNLAADAARDAITGEYVRRIEGIEINQERLTLRFKPTKW